MVDSEKFQHEFVAIVHVPLEMAIRAGYAQFGDVPLLADLRQLSDVQRALLVEWGEWRLREPGDGWGTPWPVLAGTKGYWQDAEAAKDGRRVSCGRIVATTVPASFNDVLLALEARRDRQPQELEFEKIAQARRARRGIP